MWSITERTNTLVRSRLMSTSRRARSARVRDRADVAVGLLDERRASLLERHALADVALAEPRRKSATGSRSE